MTAAQPTANIGTGAEQPACPSVLEAEHRRWVEALGPLLGARVKHLALEELVGRAGFEPLQETVGASPDASRDCLLWVHQVRLRDPGNGVRLLVGGHLLSWLDTTGRSVPAYRNLITFEVNRIDAPEPGSTLEVFEHLGGTATRNDVDTQPSASTLQALHRSLERDGTQLSAFIRAWATP